MDFELLNDRLEEGEDKNTHEWISIELLLTIHAG